MQANTPHIVTIIPTYRRPKLLRRAIRSVLAQTYPHFEVRVYDNASSDETAEVVAELAALDSRVKYHCHAENIGMVANFNYGLERVDTPYFSVLSDDDVLLPNFYETTLPAFDKYPDIAFSAGCVIEMTESGHVRNVPSSLWARSGYFAPPEGALLMTGGKHLTITGIIFHRSVIDKFGVFSSDLAISDLHYELKIASTAPFFSTTEPCAIFISHESSLTAQANVKYWWEQYSLLIRHIEEDQFINIDVRNQLARVLKHQLHRSVFGLGLRAAANQDLEDTRQSANILKTCACDNMKAFILEVSIYVCQKSPVLQRVFRTLYNIFRIRRINHAKLIQQDFAHYLTHLTAY